VTTAEWIIVCMMVSLVSCWLAYEVGRAPLLDDDLRPMVYMTQNEWLTLSEWVTIVKKKFSLIHLPAMNRLVNQMTKTVEDSKIPKERLA